MKPVSLADISYTEGLQLLALRKQALDSGAVSPMTKAAFALSDSISQVGQKYLDKVQNMDPSVRNTLLSTLIGGGLGATAGLGSAALNRGKGWKRKALMGGLSGAAVGGGLGLALNPDLLKGQQTDETPTVKRPSLFGLLGTKEVPVSPEVAEFSKQSPSEQTTALESLKDRSNTSPILKGIGIQSAMTAPAAYAASKIHGYESYDPEKAWSTLENVANKSKPDTAVQWQKLFNRDPKISPEPKPISEWQKLFNRDSLPTDIESRSALEDMKLRFPSAARPSTAPPIPATTPSGAQLREEFLTGPAGKAPWWRRPTGKLDKTTADLFKDIVDDPKLLTNTGFKGKGKFGLLAALLGTYGLGTLANLKSTASGIGDRSSARGLLEQLQEYQRSQAGN